MNKRLIIKLAAIALIFFTVGILFFIGGTGMENTSSLTLNPDNIEELRKLKSEKRFVPDQHFYTGAPSEELRVELERLINLSIDEIMDTLQHKSTISNILSVFETGLSRFDKGQLDSEEQDRICGYYDRICEILGIESTEGLLNKWRYGAALGSLLSLPDGD